MSRPSLRRPEAAVPNATRNGHNRASRWRGSLLIRIASTVRSGAGRIASRPEGVEVCPSFAARPGSGACPVQGGPPA